MLTTRLFAAMSRLIAGCNSSAQKRRKPAPVFQTVESLETRMLPAAALTATLTGGVLKIEGTNAKDNITVRQSNGIAGTSLSIDNIKISENGRLVSSVNFNSVAKIEVRALGGDDWVNLRVDDWQAVTVKATIWGGTGNDTLQGGNANDTIYGNSGSDQIWGHKGNDFLSAGTAGVDGATVAEKDKLFGGEGFDKFKDGFDFNQWVIGGTSLRDIQQRQSPTCQTLATLGAAVQAGISFTSSKITYLGNQVYNVKLYSNGQAVFEKVTFDGTYSDNDPAPVTDSQGFNTPEFWTILMQRARMERFYGVDWSQEMTDADWDRANDRNGGGLYHTTTAMKQLHGWTASVNNAGTISGQSLRDAILAKKLVVGGTPGEGKQLDAATGIVNGHAYTIVNAWSENGAWKVKIYNPWGSDGSSTPRDGTNDGFVTLSLSEFQKNFSHVYIGVR